MQQLVPVVNIAPSSSSSSKSPSQYTRPSRGDGGHAVGIPTKTGYDSPPRHSRTRRTLARENWSGARRKMRGIRKRNKNKKKSNAYRVPFYERINNNKNRWRRIHLRARHRRLPSTAAAGPFFKVGNATRCRSRSLSFRTDDCIGTRGNNTVTTMLCYRLCGIRSYNSRH